MPQNTTPKEHIEPVRGREVITEAARLLHQLQVSANGSASAEGRHVAVSVDPRWSADHQTIQLLITCYAFGHRQVSWEGLPVFVLPQEREGRGWLAWLNARGQTVVPHLPPGAYRLSTSARYGRSATPVALRTHSAGLAAAGAAVPTAVRTQGAGESGEPLEPAVYESTDGQVLATVRQTPADKAEVAFETQDEALAGATVRFAFVQASGKIEQTAEVQLNPVAGQQGLWEGDWEDFVELSEPCSLVFEVAPKEE